MNDNVIMCFLYCCLYRTKTRGDPSYTMSLVSLFCRKIRHNWDIFVCLFVWGFSTHSRIFQSFGDVTIGGKILQILTYARHSWPLSSQGPWTCHTYCDKCQPFIMVISDDPRQSHMLPSIWQLRCHYLC